MTKYLSVTNATKRVILTCASNATRLYQSIVHVRMTEIPGARHCVGKRSIYRRSNMDVSKLPKWAQEHIGNLEMQRNAAIKALNRFQDEQTKSACWVEDAVCSGEAAGPTCKKHYIQSRRVTFKVGKSDIDLYLREDNVLDISTSFSRLRILPVAANVIRIEES